jgi:hypothetical protein
MNKAETLGHNGGSILGRSPHPKAITSANNKGEFIVDKLQSVPSARLTHFICFTCLQHSTSAAFTANV